MFDIKSPYLNSVVEPARLVTLTDIVSNLPAGRNNLMIGSIMSFTNLYEAQTARAQKALRLNG
jgi:hypothetical protein